MSALALEAMQHSFTTQAGGLSPLNEQDEAVLESIRMVLQKHGYEDRFGVTLLTKSFDYAANEVLVEETDVESRVSRFSLYPRGEDGNTVKTNWKFFKNGETYAAECRTQCRPFGSAGHSSGHVIFCPSGIFR
jgi:hypothetical protein